MADVSRTSLIMPQCRGRTSFVLQPTSRVSSAPEPRRACGETRREFLRGLRRSDCAPPQPGRWPSLGTPCHPGKPRRGWRRRDHPSRTPPDSLPWTCAATRLSSALCRCPRADVGRRRTTAGLDQRPARRCRFLRHGLDGIRTRPTVRHRNGCNQEVEIRRSVQRRDVPTGSASSAGSSARDSNAAQPIPVQLHGC
jgi:hypothetical protein